MAKDKKQKSYQFGLWAEYIAMAVMMLKGYRVLARRYKTKTGEIDLILCRRKCLVFMEVKARSDLSTALECLKPSAQRRIESAANTYIQSYPQLYQHELRFDFFAFASVLRWQHIDNAWMTAS